MRVQMITFQQEFFREIKSELPELFFFHWQEVALDKEKIVVNPHWEKYLFLEEQGVLKIITARAEGKLVGYYFGLVSPHLHYAHCLTAHSDIFYLAPEHRYGYNGVRLFLEAEKMLKRCGAVKWYVASKIHGTPYGRKKTLDMEPMFNRIGLVMVEKHYTKLLIP